MKPLNKRTASQEGMTIFGGLLILLFVSAIALVVIRITPAYFQNYTVKRVLGDMVEEGSSLALREPFFINDSLRSRLKASAIHDTTGWKIKVKRAGEKTIITIDYEVRKPIIGNLTALMDFHDKAILVPN